MHELSTLAVTRENDLGVGALSRSPANQVGHSGGSSAVTANQETGDVGGIGHTLDRELASSTEPAGKVVEEEWADGLRVADVALLGSSAGVDN